jgi:phage shock protein C
MKPETTGDHVLAEPQPKRLLRSRSNRMIAGVAGGMAGYFGIDSRLVRLGWVIAAVMGWGLFAYAICWIFVPEEPSALELPPPS